MEIYLIDTPTHEQEVGRGPHKLRMLGRIVEVRSTKQSVIKVLTLKSYLLMYSTKQSFCRLFHLTENWRGAMGPANDETVLGADFLLRVREESGKSVRRE